MQKREILFRGKDIKGNWHIGLLAHIGNAWYISNKSGVATAFEVIPETVGQYTGLNDKNGVKIFEGDIVKCTEKSTPITVNGIIKYGRYTDVDSVDNYDYLGWYLEVFNRCISILQLEVDEIEMEVIDNICDNPELIKE